MLWLLACAADPVPVEDTGAPDGGPTLPTPTPALDADGVAAALTLAYGSALPNLAPIARAVTSLFDAGDEVCPGPEYSWYSISVFDPAGCTSRDGYWFQGAGAFGMGLKDEDGDGLADQFSAELKMDMGGRDPEGHVLEVGGDSTLDAAIGDRGPETFDGFFAGTYRWTGDEDWLADGISAGLFYEADIAEGTAAAVRLDGAVTVGEEAAFGFDDVSLGGDCGDAPTGTALLRGEDGHWYRLAFDPTSCDGCGEVTFAGQDLGAACVDLETPAAGMVTSLYDWVSERIPLLGPP